MTETGSQTHLAIGDGILSALGQKMSEMGLAGRAFMITDRRVGERFASAAREALERGDTSDEALLTALRGIVQAEVERGG